MKSPSMDPGRKTDRRRATPGSSSWPTDGECSADRRAATPPRISNGRVMRPIIIATTVLVCAASVAAAQTQPAAPPQGRGIGRGARPQGPPGPVPRLPDGHPDLTGIWNGFAAVGTAGRGADAP